MHNTCRFMYTTIQMHNALEFKYPAIEIHNTCKFKYRAIQTRSTCQFKSVENIYYQVPVYKNRGGCCYSYYLHRWWVGCGKPTKGSSPTSGNIVVLTRVPIPTVVGPKRGKSTPCVRLAMWEQEVLFTCKFAWYLSQRWYEVGMGRWIHRGFLSLGHWSLRPL